MTKAEFGLRSAGVFPASATLAAARTGTASTSVSLRRFRLDLHPDGAPFQAERLAVNKGVRHFSTRLFYDSGKRRPRDLHLLCRLLLVEPVQVRQTQGFDLIQRQCHLLEGANRNPGRSKEAGIRREPDMTQTTRSWHASIPFCKDSYEHMFITKACQEGVPVLLPEFPRGQRPATLFWTKGDSSRRRLMILGIFSMVRSTSSSVL